MVVTPGPAIVVIPIGLAILAIEFAWARRWLKKLRRGASSIQQRWRTKSPAPSEADANTGPPAVGGTAAHEPAEPSSNDRIV